MIYWAIVLGLGATNVQMWGSWLLNELSWVVNLGGFFFLSLTQVWLFSKLRRFLPPENSSRQAYIRGASEGWLACPFCFPCDIKRGCACDDGLSHLLYKVMVNDAQTPLSCECCGVDWAGSPGFAACLQSQSVPQVTFQASLGGLIIKGHSTKVTLDDHQLVKSFSLWTQSFQWL